MSSEALANALVAHLAAAGVRHVVLSPGSRSAPLAYALARAERSGILSLDVRVDERSAGFVALGIAKVRGLAAVVTTSGTAVANLHPAVLEASHAGAGLIVISADRPAELRATGANQTTLHPGIFARDTRFDADLAADTPVSSVRGVIARAVAAACGVITRDPGPVHLNVQFRPPLGPPSSDTLVPRVAGAEPIVLEDPPQPRAATLDASPRTVVVAGDGAGPEIAEIAERAGFPLLAEPSSGARTAYTVLRYPRLLTGDLVDDLERVIVAGHPTLSRPVMNLLTRTDIEIVVVSAGPRWTDVAATAARIVPAIEVRGAGDPAYLARWRDAQNAARNELTPRERCVSEIWSAGGNLVLGSSSTIRTMDVVAAGEPPRVWANRGLSGIDGTISTAIGIARALGEPVRAVVGDLAFLHDATALVKGSLESEVDLQVVVLDDGGGSIFASLEYGARRDEEFERIFRTPQVMDIPALARSLGAATHAVDADLAADAGGQSLADLLRAPITGRSVVHVKIPS